jgi:DNA-nicking Smr family endonuclease
MSRPPRKVTAEELALWRSVLADAQPLRHARRPATPAPPPAPAVPAPAAAPPAPPAAVLTPAPVPARPPPGPGPMDRKLERRLLRGQMPVEGRLDLHGLTQSQAHHALADYVRRAHDGGRRVLLVITGKGYREGTGVLRAAVPRWLHEAPLRGLVAAARPASPRDGGEGALYLLLRRKKPA